MADSENLHLKAAGRTGGSSRGRHCAPSSRGRCDNACSVSGSGSRGHSSRKRKSSLPSAGVGSSCQREIQDDSQTNNPTYEDILEITIRRSRLAKWFLEPYFEDLIVGCFVRVGIGMKSGQRIYRLCIVRNVDASELEKKYMLENKMTHKYLNCVWGSESSAARWQMDRISDSPPLREEYDQWKEEVERRNGMMPTKNEVEKKKEEIEKTKYFVYSSETLKHMIEEKRSAAIRPWNIAAEKARLRAEMTEALYRNDESQIEKIKARLEELAALRQAEESKNPRDLRIQELNKKNRTENFNIGSKLKTEEAGYDPSKKLSRWTNQYAADRNKGEKSGVEATAAALESALDAGKLVDSSAPVDQGNKPNILHNFDQQVPEDDGRKHPLTKSVSDYKRRKGMP